MLNRRLDDGIPFQWHHHPEFELTLTLNSRGQRFIGDHSAQYDDCDLVLVSPNQPHTWVSTQSIDPAQPHVALVIWFAPDWAARLAQDFVEFKHLGHFLAHSRQGLAFSNGLARDLRPMFERFFDQPPTERLLTVLRILDRLRQDADATPLASAPTLPTLPAGPSGSPARIDRLLTHIHLHYASEIRMQDLAEVTALSVSGVHRLFRKHTRTTVTDYIIALRIGDACARLMGSEQPVAHIADEVGYRSLANFNRQFKNTQGMTPRSYRAQFQRS